MTLKVTVTDVETGDVGETEVPTGDYLLICHDPCYLAGTIAHQNGTHVLTVKGRTAPPKVHVAGGGR